MDFLRRTSMGRLVLGLVVLYFARRSKADWWCLRWLWEEEEGGRRWLVAGIVSLSGMAPDMVRLSDVVCLDAAVVGTAFVCDEDSRCAREWRLGSGLTTLALLLVILMTSGHCLLLSLPGRCKEHSVSVA